MLHRPSNCSVEYECTPIVSSLTESSLNRGQMWEQISSYSAFRCILIRSALPGIHARYIHRAGSCAADTWCVHKCFSAILFRPMVIEHAKYVSTEKLAHSLHPLHPKPLGRLHPLCRLRYDLSKRVCVDVGLYTHPVHLLLLCSSILPHCSVT